MAAKIATKETEGNSVRVAFTDGEVLEVSLGQLPEDIVKHLALHGLSQKLGDSYAGEKDVEVAKAKAKKVAERLQAGEWKAVREGSGGGRITDLAQALARVTGKELAECVSVITDMDKEQKKALRQHPQIKVALAEIAAEKAKAKAAEAGEVDLGSLIG